LKALLGSYNDEVAMATLDVYYFLACPPLSHLTLEYTRHSTVLHKSSSLCHPIFEIIDAAHLSNKMTAEDICSRSEVPTDVSSFKYDFMNRLHKNTITSADGAITEALIAGVEADCPYLALDLAVDMRSFKEIMKEHHVSDRFRVSLQWNIRIRRYLLTANKDGNYNALKIQLAAAAILLCCHPSSLSLAHYFQDKVEFFRVFLILLKTGPGSTVQTSTEFSDIPMELRLMSNQCLAAIIGSKDASASILSRFSWLQHDLGLNRSQYMGLLPCLLRYITSTYLSYEKNPEFLDGKALLLYVEWAESVLSLIFAVLNVPPFLVAFIDNGMISLLLSMFKHKQTHVVSVKMYTLVSLVAQILDMAINSNTHALSVFKDSNGLEIISSRITSELLLHFNEPDVVSSIETSVDIIQGTRKRKKTTVTAPSKNKRLKTEIQVMGTLPCAVRILIHTFMQILSSCFHEGYSDGSDSRLAQLIRSPSFGDILMELLRYAIPVSPPVLCAALSMLTEAINNDPAPPSILSIMVSNGVAEASLRTITLPGIEFISDSILASVALISSLALSEEGLNLVHGHNPFPCLIAQLTDPRYVTPHANIFMKDLPLLLGNSLEELVRHHSFLTRLVLRAIIEEMGRIARLAEAYKGITLEDGDACFLQLVHFASSLVNCLEPLLHRKQTAVEFILSDGVDALTKMIKLALGPSKYLLSVLCCSIDPSTSSIGSHPIVKTSLKCFSRLTDHDSKAFVRVVVPLINKSYEKLRRDLEAYWKKFAVIVNKSQQQLMSKDKSKTKGKTSGLGLHLDMLLETIPTLQMHEVCRDGVSLQMLALAKVFKSLLFLNYLIEALSSTFSTALSTTANKCIFFDPDDPTVKKLVDLLFTLVHDVYTSSQMELCRARGSLSEGKRFNEVRCHPVYRILIVAQEGVVVKSSSDETGKKVYKLERGMVLDAYERVCSPSHSLKYRVDGGWVSYVRHSSSTEPQLQVIEVSPKSAEQLIADEAAAVPVDTPQKLFDLDKYTNLSCRRGGFMAIFHFHTCMRRLLSCVSRSMAPTIIDSKSYVDRQLVSAPLIEMNVRLLISCLSNLLPGNQSEFRREVALPGPSDQSKGSFVAFCIPTLAEFDLTGCFRAIHVVELCSSLLFDEKRIGKNDCNTLLLAHLFYSGILEKLMGVTVNVYLSCLRLAPASSTTGPSALEVDNLSMDEGDVSSHGDTDEGRRERRMLKERRILAVSNVDNVIEFWRIFLNSMGGTADADPLARRLQSMANDDCDFDALVLRRKVLQLVLRHIYQCWSHPLMYSLPPTTVRTMLDMMHVSVKNLLDVKAFPSRFVAATTRDKTDAKLSISSLIGLDPASDALSSSTSRISADDHIFMDENGFLTVALPRNEGDTLSAAEPGRVPRSGTSRLNTSGDALAYVSSATSTASPSGAVSAFSSSTTAILPPIAKHSEEELLTDKETVQLMLKQVYRSIHPSCLSLLELGVKNQGVHWSSEAALANKSFTREQATMMVLKELHKCYERSTWVANTLQIIHLAWLYRKTLGILRAPDRINYGALYNLLHAILLLLSGKVSGRVCGHEALTLIFSRESRYSCLCDLLLETMERTLQQEADHPGQDPEQIEWISPAILLLDVFSQSYLVDQGIMRQTLSELEKVLKATGRNDTDCLVSIDAISLLKLEFRDRSQKETPEPDSNERDFINSIAPEPIMETESSETVLSTIEDGIASSPELASNLVISSVSKAEIRREKQVAFIENCVICRNTLDVPSIGYDSSVVDVKCSTIARGACSHSFHLDCIENWTKSRSVCPECDTSWSVESSYTLELKADVEDVVSSSSTAVLLRDGGLSVGNKKKALRLCLGILAINRRESPMQNLLSQSCLQLLIHILDEDEVKQEFLVNRGLHQLLDMSASFSGLSNHIFTVAQRVFEDMKCLSQVMETAMKLCIVRLAKSKPPVSSRDPPLPRVQLRFFLEALSPLIVRNQAVFLQAMRSHVQLTRLDKAVYVSIKPMTMVDGDKDKSLKTTTDIVIHPDVSSTPTAGGNSAVKSKHISHHKKGANETHAHFLPQPVYTAFESMILAICSQLAIAVTILSTEDTIAQNVTCCLKLPELFFTLADLVYTIPGLATCIHRFNISKINALQHPIVSACIGKMKHAITGKPISPTRFLPFLIHTLVAYDAQLEVCQKLSAAEVGIAKPWTNKIDSIKELVGLSLDDSASYFLAALIARPGDGRRRALEELLEVLRGEERLNSSHKIKAALAICRTINSLILPPPTWSSRDIFYVPSKDNIILLASLDAHKVLSNVLCRLDMSHALAIEAAENLATFIEIVIRKGVHLQQHQNKAVISEVVASIPASQVDSDVVITASIPFDVGVPLSVPSTPQASTHATAADNALTNGRPIENLSSGMDDAGGLLRESDDEDDDDIAAHDDDSDDSEDGEVGHDSEDDEHLDSDSDAGEEVCDSCFSSGRSCKLMPVICV
jgi:hypothetical protein